MPYVTSDGRIQSSRPWSIARVIELFWGIINFFTFFFRSLLHLDEPSRRGAYGVPPPRGRNNLRFRGSGSRMGGFSGPSNLPPPPPCIPGGG